MKEKILSKLKSAVSDGKNALTGISEKTIEDYAEIYGKKITDESLIDAEMETIVSSFFEKFCLCFAHPTRRDGMCRRKPTFHP
jgi:hypothetical protein